MKRNYQKKMFAGQNLRELSREFAWIGQYSLMYKGQVLFYSLLGILGTGLGLAGSVVSKYIIDAVTGYENSALITAGIFYVLMQLLRIGISAVTSRISAKINIRVSQHIRSDIYDKIMTADWQQASRFHSGDLLNRLTNDATSVASSVLGWIPDLVTRLLQFLGTLGVILYYDPTLAVLALLSAPVTLVMSRFVAKRMREHNQEMRQLSSEMMVFEQESFHNLQTIKAFALTEHHSKQLRTLQKKLKTASLDYNLFSVGNSALMSLVGTVVTLVCLGWGVYRLWSGHITYGTMTLFLQLSGSLAAAFSALVNLVPSAINAGTAAKRIMEVTKLPREDLSRENDTDEFLQSHRQTGVQITAKELSFGYGDHKDVFSQVNFQADAGQIVALIGHSGGGKTTLLRLLLGIVKPRSGELFASGPAGDDPIFLSASSRKLFSYVPQSNTMFSGTVRENLCLVKPDATDEELYRVLEIACADTFVRNKPMGLDTPVLEKGGGFSQGQIQRLSIARALLTQTPVLLMDEATSALDITTERKILDNIMSSGKLRTCIVTTHRPSVLGICHRVYRVEDGAVTPVSREEAQQMMKEQ